MFQRKLTDEEVELIRKAHEEHLRLIEEAMLLSVKSLSAKMELSESSIRDIIKFRTYKQVQPHG